LLFFADYTEFLESFSGTLAYFKTVESPSFYFFWLLFIRFDINLGILLVTIDFFGLDPVTG